MKRPDRAQSEVIGVVLLLGLTITAVGITVGLGSTALADVQSSADIQRIEGTMTQLDSKASLVAHGGSTSQRVRLGPGRSADVRVDDDAGVMRIEVEAENAAGDLETATRNVTLGTIVYERGDDRVAYQGGGVWRSNGDGSWMVSPPEFHYRGDTLTLPLVTINGTDGRLGDAAVVTDAPGHPEGLFPAGNVSNPLLGGNVTVTVESEYAEAWGRFFETRTRANVTQVSPTEVRVALRTETVHPTLSAGASAVGTTEIAAGGIRRLHADSYNSEDGPYGPATASDRAIVKTRSGFGKGEGGIGNTEEIRIRGDLLIGANEFPPGQVEKKLNVSGDIRTGVEFADVDSISGAITERMNRIRDQNIRSNVTCDIVLNDGTDCIIDEDTYVNGSVSVSDGSTLRIEDGANVHVNGGISVGEDGSVEFDSSGSDPTVLVDGELVVENNGQIRSDGGGRADLLVDGAIEVRDAAAITTADDTRFELYNTGNLDVEDKAQITADDGVAKNLWLYSSGTNINFRGDAADGIDFSGVVYAPTSKMQLNNQMTYNGSFTSDSFQFDDADLSLHYDESLQDAKPFEGNSVPVVSHLHVSRHRITVEDD